MRDLQVSVANLQDRGAIRSVDVTTEWDPEALGIEGIRITEPIKLRGSVTRTGRGYLFQGKAKTQVEADCHRCLKPFELDLETEIEDEFYRASGEVSPEEELGLTEDEGRRFSGNTLDLGEMVREAISLALPIQVFCTEDCPGLCPTCGRDQSGGDCGCIQVDLDPRFAVLEGLRKDLNGQKQ